VNDFNPHVIVDMHEYSAGTPFGEGQYVHGSDGLYNVGVKVVHELFYITRLLAIKLDMVAVGVIVGR
jgi:hypothetical protein